MRRFSSPVVEECEPRLLYSADLAPDGLALVGATQLVEQRMLNADGDFETVARNQHAPRNLELVIVDAAVDRQQLLLAGIDEAEPQRRIEVLVLDPERDGIDQISAALAGRQDISAVHIVSHGASGELRLGSARVDLDQLAARGGQIAAWSNALTETGDILLYGCDVAAGANGEAFVQQLAVLTRADVAASSNPTGSAALGGDWMLEERVGAIQAPILQPSWSGLLAAVPAGSETRVNATIAPTQTEAAIAMAGNGSYVVVWSSGNNQDGNGNGIFAQQFDAAGNALGSEFRVNTTIANDQRRPDAAMDTNGNFVVVWASDNQDGSQFGIYGQRYDAAGVALGAEFRVNVSTTNQQDQPAVAMDAGGNFVVAWSSNHTGSADIYARRFDAAGNPLSGELLVNATTANNQDVPAVAMNAGGAFVVAWKTTNPQDGNGTGVFAQLYGASGSKIGGEFQVNSTSAGDQDRPAAAMAGDGRFFIAWVSGNNQDGDRNGVFAQRFGALGAKQGGEFRVNTTTQDNQDFPSIATDSAGNFTVTWESNNQDGGGSGIYLQQYDATGFALGAETQVNTTTANNQAQPAIGMRPGGDFVVAWTGNGPGDTAGVFAQRYVYQNAAPVNSVPGAQAASGVAPLVFSAANGNRISIADPDAALNPVQVALSAGNGTITLAGTAGLIFSTGDGSADAAMTFSGTIPAINAALEGLSFSPAAFFFGAASLQIATSDLGHSGPGGALADTDSVAIAVAPLGTPYVVTGSYTGNATDNRPITGLGFQPDLVIIKVRDDAKVAVARTSTMAGDAAKEMTGGTALVANEIQSLDADGFTIGTDDTVNKAAKTYDWIAFKASSGWMSLGSYSGNGVAGRSLSGVGFSPEAVFVFDSGNQEAVFRLAGGASESYDFDNEAGDTGWITSLDADGFSVGNDARVNASGRAYLYVAWNEIPGTMAVGSYSGNGADSRNIAGVGFQPEWVLVKSEGGDHVIQHFDSAGATNDVSVEFSGSAFDTNRIQALQADGFQVGTDNDVNNNGRLYSYLAFRQQTRPTISNIADQTTSEGTATAPIAFTIGDAETAAANLLVRATSSNPTLVPDANIVLAGGGANRTVTLTPVGNLTGTATITLEASDGASSGVDTFVLTVAAVNDPPVNTLPAAQSTVLNTPLVFSTANGNPIVVSDSDAGASAIQVALSVTSGTLTLSGVGGLAFSTGDGTSDSAMTFTGAIASINTALNGLRFDPAVSFSGPVVLTITSNDLGNTGTGGAKSTTDTLAIGVAYANRAPTLAGANNLAPINEDPPANSGTLVSTLIAGKVSDPDANALTGIAVIAVDNTNGTWEYSIDSGATWVAFGSPTPTSARLLAADANTSVRFVPNANWNGTVTGGLTFRAWDRTSGVEGGTADVTASVVNTVRDQFSSVSYTSNDGTSVWAGGWIDVDGNPSAGNIQVSGGQLVLNANLLNSDTIAREVNLLGASSATLSFSYNNALALLSSVALQVSSNGGGSYTTIATFSPSSNAGNGTFSTDISSFIAANTRIRFSINGVLLGNTLSVDNVQIAYLTSSFSSASASSNVTVNSVNDAPVGTSSAVTTLEDADYVFTAADFGFTDPADNPTNALLGVSVATLPGAGTLTLNAVAVTAGQLVSAADINAGLLRFTPGANGSGAAYAAFTFQVQDDGGTTNGGVDLDPVARTLSIHVTAVNDAPDGRSGTVTTPEDTPYVFRTADFGFADATDTPSNSLLSVRIAALPGSGTLALAGSAVVAGQFVSVADIDAGKLVFTPAADANGAGYASFTFQVQDDGGTANGGIDLDPTPATVTLDVSGVNDAPVNVVPGIQGTDQDVTLTFSAGNAIVITDIDAGTNPLQITLTAANGTLTLNGTTGLAFTTGDGSADASMVFTGSLADINAALNGLQFAPTAGFSGTGSIQVATDDLGNSGAGGALTDSDSVPIIISSANEAPINSVPGAQSVAEDGTLVLSSGNGNAISVTDVDAGGSPLEVTLSATNGRLSLNGTAGLTFIIGDGSADATMTFTGTIASINAALDGLIFAPTADFHGAASLSLTTNDQGNTGTGGAQSDTDTVNITVTPVADTPTVSNASTNEDTQSISGLVISPNAVDGAEVTHYKITAISGGTLYLNDGVTPIADGDFITVAAGAAGLKFTPAGDSVANGGFSVQASVATNDSGLGGSVVTATISVTPVNDQPILSLGASPASDEDAGAQALAGFASASPGGGADEAGQTFIYSVTNDNNALFAGQPAIDAAGQLTYTAAANANGSATVTVFVTDSGGTANGGVDTSAPQTFTISVNAVNDAPVNTVPGAQSVNEDTVLVFSTGNANAISIADLDAGGGSVQVTLGVTNGTLTLNGSAGLAFTTGDGTADASMVFTGTIASVNAALNGLAFTPAADFNGTASLSLATNDQGNNGSGGALTDSDLVAITVNAVNDAPVNTVPGAQAVNEDTALAISGVSVNDVDANLATTSLSVTSGAVTVNLAGGATISAGANGSAALTLSGTQAQINAALATLSYQGNPNFNGADTLTVLSTDTNAATDSDTVAITVNAVNDAPSFTLGASPASDEDAGAQALAGFASASPGGGADEAGQTFIYSVTNDNNALFAGQPAIDAAGQLTYTAAANANGSATVTVFVTDSGGTANGGVDTSAPQTFTISVNAVNDAPVNTVPGAQSVNEDTVLVFSTGNANAISIADLDAGGGSVQVTLGVTNGTLTLNGSAGLAFTTGDGTADASMVFTGTIASVNAALNGLAFTPAADFNGTASLSLATNDQGNNGSGGALTDSDLVAITVNAVNDAPVNTVPGAQAVNEDTALAISGVSVNDVDANLATTSLSVTSGAVTVNLAGGATISAGANGSAALTLSGTQAQINAALATLSYQGNPNFNGADTLTVLSTDTNAATDSDTVAITVNAVNDAPSFTLGASPASDEDAGAQALAGFASASPGGGADEAGQTFIYSVTNDNNALFAGQPAIDAAGQLTYTAAANANGSATVTVFVTDSGGTANGGVDTSGPRTFILTVNAVNDAPTAANRIVTLVGTASVVIGPGDLGYSDPDGDTLSSVTITALPGLGVLRLDDVAVAVNQPITGADLAAGRLRYFAPTDAGQARSAGFGFRVSDGVLDSVATYTISLSLQPVGVLLAAPAAPATETIPALNSVGAPSQAVAIPVEIRAEESNPNARGADAADAAEATSVLLTTNVDVASTTAASAAASSATGSATSLGSEEFQVRNAVLRHMAIAHEPPSIMLAQLAGFTPERQDPGEAPELRFVAAATRNTAFIQQLDRLRGSVQEEAALQQRVIVSSIAVGASVSIGYVLWLLRGGVLLASLLSSLPAWRFVDPLPVLARLGGDEEEDEESLESIVGDGEGADLPPHEEPRDG